MRSASLYAALWLPILLLLQGGPHLASPVDLDAIPSTEEQEYRMCLPFLDKNAVAQKYHRDLLQASQACSTSTDPLNRLAFADCVLGKVLTHWTAREPLSVSATALDTSGCMFFALQYVMDKNTSVAEQFLRANTRLLNSASATQQVVVQTIRHLLRNLTCTAAVPPSMPIRQTTWTHVRDRNFSKYSHQLQQTLTKVRAVEYEESEY